MGHIGAGLGLLAQALLFFECGVFAQVHAGGNDESGEHREQDDQAGNAGGTVAVHKLAEPVKRARRARLHRLTGEKAGEIGGEAVDGFVAAGAVFFQALHDDLVEVAFHGGEPFGGIGIAASGGGRRIGACQTGNDRRWGRDFPVLQDFEGGRVANRAEFRRIEGGPSANQFVEQDAEAINIAAGVHVAAAAGGLFRAHRGECAHGQSADFRQAGRQLRAIGGLGDAEIDDLGLGFSILHGNEHV